METKITNNYKDYIQLLPYVSGLIILISIVKAIIFYSVFGIRIVSYLDLSECVLIFLDQLLLIAIAMTFGVFITLSEVITLFVPRNKRNSKVITKSRNDQIVTKPKQSNIIIPNRFVIFFGICFLLYFSFFQFSRFPIREAIIAIIIFFFLIIFFPHLPLIFQPKLPNYSPTIFLIITSSIFYFGIIVNYGLFEAYNIKYGASKQEVNLTFKTNEIINTSDTLVYIGTTRNYLFFYNPNSMKKTIFMKSELTKLSIQ